MNSSKTALFTELGKILPKRAVEILQTILADDETPMEHHGGLALDDGKRPRGTEVGALWIAPGSTARFRGTLYGSGKWCVLTEPWTSQIEPNTGLTEYYGTCLECDQHGVTRQGGRLVVRLCMTGQQQPDFEVGEPVPVFHDADGRPFTFPCARQPIYSYTSSASPVGLDEDGELVLIAP